MPPQMRIACLLSEIRESLLDLFYPRQDLWTDEPVHSPALMGKYLSQGSHRYLRFIQEPFCAVCGFPLYGMAEGSEGCQQCVHLEAPAFESNRSVLLLNRLGRRIVHELKYHQGLYLLGDLQRLIATHASEGLRNRVVGHQLVPVPLHPSKQRERGYNQSFQLAQLFRKTLGDRQCRVVEGLQRSRPTESQTLMDRSSRMHNVKAAFTLHPRVQLDPMTPITLIDDVFTTGSTIHECARVLRRAGLGPVRSLTLGHG